MAKRNRVVPLSRYRSQTTVSNPRTAPDPPVDANFDADTIDLSLIMWDLNTGVAKNPMFPISSIPTIKGRSIAFDLEEIHLGYSIPPAQGTELNGNAFPGDHIVCFFDRKRGTFTSTGVSGFCSSGNNLEGNLIVFEGQYNGLVGYALIP